MRRALITGLAGEELTTAEAAFLGRVRPCGIILFKRNCTSREQIRTLLDAAREAIGGSDVLTLIDQEGGRVQRLRPPLSRALPPGAAFGRLFAERQHDAQGAARLAAHLVAADLKAFGLNTNCAPVLDLPVPGAHDVIGDRAYGSTPDQVVALGRAVRDGYVAGGVLPVIKHVPGHGRATKDSHLDLPVVTTPWPELSATDFAPFRALSDSPAAMSAHVVFTAVDAQEPASTSRIVHDRIIRGEIGFDGLLMSDDLSMSALSGSIQERAEAVIRAGSDVTLHCNGNIGEMEQAARGSPVLHGRARQRYEAALAVTRGGNAPDVGAAEAALVQVMAFATTDVESV